MKSKIVIGCEPWLSLAISDWRSLCLDIELIGILLHLDENHRFDLQVLNGFSSENHDVFLAWGPDFLNFQRLEIMGEIKKLGFKFPPLISPHAFVCSTAKIEENSWICAFAAVLAKSKVGFNSRVGLYSVVGPGATLGRSVWVADRASLSEGVKVGAQSVLGDAVHVMKNVNIGRNSYIEGDRVINVSVDPGFFDFGSFAIVGQIVDYAGTHLGKLNES